MFDAYWGHFSYWEFCTLRRTLTPFTSSFNLKTEFVKLSRE